MRNSNLRLFVFRLVSIALISLGSMHVSHAGIIGTEALTQAQSGDAHVEQIRVLLERQDVATQLAALGVDTRDVLERVKNMSDAEILAFQQKLDSQMAGGDAVGIIGAVFLVLLILELVGITDIFKSI